MSWKIVRRIEIWGEPLVHVVFPNGEGALAYPRQLDDDGNLRLECQFEPGYAHITPEGEIYRNNVRIGHADDLAANETSR